jgi:hypothetical protein
MAYGSDASGRAEVFVSRFPESGGGRIQVSVKGGTEPVWRPGSLELSYRDENLDLVTVTFDPGPVLRVRDRKILFPTRNYLQDNRHWSYAASREGAFYFFERSAPSGAPVVVIQNWVEELKAKVP